MRLSSSLYSITKATKEYVKEWPSLDLRANDNANFLSFFSKVIVTNSLPWLVLHITRVYLFSLAISFAFHNLFLIIISTHVSLSHIDDVRNCATESSPR